MRHWILLLLTCGCTPTNSSPFPAVPPPCRQVVTVVPDSTCPNVTITAWSKTGDAWTKSLDPFAGVVGSGGIAPIGAKREGDKRTPSGTFPLGPAFGYEPTADTRLHYRQATADDYWIDAVQSPDYNRWVHGTKPTCSHELLRRGDDQYRLAAVIGYNLDPVIPGRGSAIFLHIWKQPGQGTDGCVALNAENVAKLLRWLDRRAEPVMMIAESGAHRTGER